MLHYSHTQNMYVMHVMYVMHILFEISSNIVSLWFATSIESSQCVLGVAENHKFAYRTGRSCTSIALSLPLSQYVPRTTSGHWNCGLHCPARNCSNMEHALMWCMQENVSFSRIFIKNHKYSPENAQGLWFIGLKAFINLSIK